jgi:hypothetical protein
MLPSTSILTRLDAVILHVQEAVEIDQEVVGAGDARGDVVVDQSVMPW